MSTISVKTSFAAGHRILGLTGPGAKCSNIHGHSFKVAWTFLQGADHMALEFGSVKANLRQMITTYFDHAFIVDRRDEFCDYLNNHKLKHYPLAGPPTTEAIAAELATLAQGLFPGATLLAVELQEGEDNVATWESAQYIPRLKKFGIHAWDTA